MVRISFSSSFHLLLLCTSFCDDTTNNSQTCSEKHNVENILSNRCLTIHLSTPFMFAHHGVCPFANLDTFRFQMKRMKLDELIRIDRQMEYDTSLIPLPSFCALILHACLPVTCVFES